MAAAAPLAPIAIRVTLRPLLIPLAMVAGYIVLRGIVYCVDSLARGLFGAAESAVGWIPWLGSKVKGKIERIEQRVTNYLGTLEDQISAKIGDSLHALATGVEHLAGEIEQAAVVGAQLAWLVTSKYSIAALYYRAAKWGVNQAADHLTIRQTKVIVRTIRTEIRYPEHGHIGAAIKAQVRSVALELDMWERALSGDIARLRARAGSLQRGYDRLYKWVRRHERALAYTALGSVAVAFVSRLGGGWIFCRNWKRLGREICRMPASGITWLLGLFALTVVALDPEEVVNAAEDAADELGWLIRKMAGLTGE